jgi:hypothetical protein
MITSKRPHFLSLIAISFTLFVVGCQSNLSTDDTDEEQFSLEVNDDLEAAALDLNSI